MDDAADLGMMITHLIIGRIANKIKSKKHDQWMSDQQLLAMLKSMRSTEFEEYIARLFQSFGYKTELNGGAGDGGIDIKMTKDSRSYIVQCKKFIVRKVTPHDVRDFYGALVGNNIDGKGYFVTTHFFTLEAERFAEGKPIELIDGQKLISLIRKSGLVVNQKPETSQSNTEADVCPKCGAKLVLRRNHKNGDEFYGCSQFPKCRFTKS